MASHDILHLTSHAFTPQQNGLAKCKNKHLVETTHNFNSWWGSSNICWVLVRVISLIICLPHSILFSHNLHPLPLKVFGSTCFVQNFSPDLDKLSIKTHKCVFLGFTRLQKGYNPKIDINVSLLLTDISFQQMSSLLRFPLL